VLGTNATQLPVYGAKVNTPWPDFNYIRLVDFAEALPISHQKDSSKQMAGSCCCVTQAWGAIPIDIVHFR